MTRKASDSEPITVEKINRDADILKSAIIKEKLQKFDQEKNNQPKCRAWAIKGLDGKLIPGFLASSQEEAKNQFLASMPPTCIFTFEAEGYKCVKLMEI